mgnify:CR=1 FL=1|tara:strand:+ start:3660 stop:4310 length:651 start_codon:yes stop_codon:yes gene_type:complete
MNDLTEKKFSIASKGTSLQTNTLFLTPEEAERLFNCTQFKELQNWSYDAWSATGNERMPGFNYEKNVSAVNAQLALLQIEQLAAFNKSDIVKFRSFGNSDPIDQLPDYSGYEETPALYLQDNNTIGHNVTQRRVSETSGSIVSIDESGEEVVLAALSQLDKNHLNAELSKFIEAFTLNVPAPQSKNNIKDVAAEILKLLQPPALQLEIKDDGYDIT